MTVTISGAYASRPAYSLHLDISIHDQDIANNRTRFDFTLYAYHDTSASNNTYSNTARAYDASIAGSSIASGTHNFLMGPSGDFVGKTIVIASGTTGYFTHNPDGTLTVSLSAYHNMSPDIMGNASASGSFTVTPIPRATQPTVSPTSGNTGSTYAIDVSTVASSAFYHDFYYSLDGGSTYTSIAANVPATTTSQNWTPAHSLLPNSTGVTAVIKVDTRSSSGGTIIGSKTTNLTLTVPSSVKPTVSSVAWVDSQVSAPDMPTLMGGAGRFVQRWSKLKPTATSSGASGSTVTETDITVNAQTVQSGSAFGSAVALSGAVPYSAVAIDTRLRASDPLTGTVPVTAYNFPNLPTPTVTRTSDAAGLVPSPSGTYLAITPAASVSSLVFAAVEKNLLEWQIRIKPVGGAYTTVQAWTNATVSGNTWTTKAIFGGYSASTGYVIEVSIRDLFGKNGYDTADTVVTLTIQVPSESVVIDFDRNNGIGFGKYRQLAPYDFAGGINGDADIAGLTLHQGVNPVVDFSDAASTSTPGISQLATDAESITGTNAAKAITPHGLLAALVAQAAAQLNKVRNGSFRTNQRAYASTGALPPCTYGFDAWCGAGLVNLINNPTGGAATAYTNWTTDTGAGGSIAGVTKTFSGQSNQTKAIRSTMGASSTGGFYLNGNTGAGAPVVVSGLPQIKSGRTYTFYIWVNASVAKTMTITAQQYNDSGGAIGSPIVSAGVAVSATTDTLLTLTFTAANQANRVSFLGGVTVAWSVGQTLTYGAAMLLQCAASALPAAYFDGASTGCQWAGTANASVSYNVSTIATLTFTPDPHGQTVTLNSGGTLQQVLERGDNPAATYTVFNDGTATMRLFNAGTAPGSRPAFTSGSASIVADGTDDIVLEITASGGTKTITNVRMFQGAVDYGFSLPSVSDELSACQRYFVSFAIGDVILMNPYMDTALTGGAQFVTKGLLQTMRVAPFWSTSAGATLGVFGYLSWTAGAQYNGNVRLNSSSPVALSAGYSSGDNSGTALAIGYASASNNSVLWADAEMR